MSAQQSREPPEGMDAEALLQWAGHCLELAAGRCETGGGETHATAAHERTVAAIEAEEGAGDE